MAYTDSVDKIVGYFEAVTTKPFTYKSKTYFPKTLRVSPGLLQGYTCPPMCGGCCRHRFSLDYLPTEQMPDSVAERRVQFNGRSVRIMSDLQQDHDQPNCKHLIKSNGRCGIHEVNPFSCDFELMRFSKFSDIDRNNQFTTRLFGRGWAMLRVDQDRGALCEIIPVDQVTIDDGIRKLRRLRQWCDHFGLEHKVGDIIDWADDASARQHPLFV